MNDLRYIAKVGQGTHGTTYLMKSNIQHKYFICKSFNSKCKKYANREISILKNLTHYNIVKYINQEDTENSNYIILEYANYGNLENFNKYFIRRNINIKFIYSIYSQIINGLHYLHERNIIHRDVKPENILFNKKSNIKYLEVKICDFSLSTHINDITNSVVGTPYYMAPEIILRKKYDCTVDIWSLGVCMYETVTKRKPFDGPTKKHLKANILSKEIENVPNCPDKNLKYIILNCLKKEDRITSERLLENYKIKAHIDYVNRHKP